MFGGEEPRDERKRLLALEAIAGANRGVASLARQALEEIFVELQILALFESALEEVLKAGLEVVGSPVSRDRAEERGVFAEDLDGKPELREPGQPLFDRCE